MQINSSGIILLLIIGSLILGIFLFTDHNSIPLPSSTTEQGINSVTTQAVQSISDSNEKSDAPVERALIQEELEPCNDPVWCNVPMPTVSYYKFDPPTDPIKWRKAQIAASKGEHVLLKEIIKVFPNHFDFLDGDISFRKLHYAMDFFIDERRDLSPLVSGMSQKTHRKGEADDHFKRRQLAETYPTITAPKTVNGKLMYPWELNGRRVVPDPYDFRTAKRAPVVGVGYTAFKRDSQTYYTGDRLGGAFIDRKTFFNHWRKVKNRIDTPWIAICSLNENWGFLSTRFPNRTAGWGQCCTKPGDSLIYDFLNHDKTLLLATNQHTNVSHPKLLILPRGIPLTWGFTRMLVWDTQRNTIKETKKDKLLFAASSKWGPRPQILRCISEKFSPNDFDGHVKNPPQPRLDRPEYYKKLSSAYFGVGLPGLGYDCFRAWELMTSGTIVVLEKNVGFDRTVSKFTIDLLDLFTYFYFFSFLDVAITSSIC
jgi:hypothetical protein